MATKPTPNGNDYRGAPGGGAKTKPIYNPADYRSGFNLAPGAGGKGKKGKKAKIWHASHRLAPGAKHDPWGGHGHFGRTAGR